MIGRAVPFVGTAGVSFDEIRPGLVTVSIANRRRVRNHIGSVHAVAMTLLAEGATGFVVAMSIPDDKVPVVKSLTVQFVRRASGALTATATLTHEDIARIERDEKGEIRVPVQVLDETGAEPITVEAVWAWSPKRRPA